MSVLPPRTSHCHCERASQLLRVVVVVHRMAHNRGLERRGVRRGYGSVLQLAPEFPPDIADALSAVMDVDV